MTYCPSDKIIYQKKQQAADAAKGIWHDDKIKMNVYKCSDCNFYHLSSAGSGKSLQTLSHGLNSILPALNKKKKKR
jgi:hypothetical protein